MHSYPTCDWNQRSHIFKEVINLRPRGHYGLFFLRWPKYYYQFSILTLPNCSIYLGQGTKFYPLTKLLNYCNSLQIVSHEKFPQNLRIPSLMPKFNSTSPWMRNMKLLYLCDMLNCHAARKTRMKKRPIRNRIHHSLSNTELRQITSVYMLTI